MSDTSRSPRCFSSPATWYRRSVVMEGSPLPRTYRRGRSLRAPSSENSVSKRKSGPSREREAAAVTSFTLEAGLRSASGLRAKTTAAVLQAVDGDSHPCRAERPAARQVLQHVAQRGAVPFLGARALCRSTLTPATKKGDEKRGGTALHGDSPVCWRAGHTGRKAHPWQGAGGVRVALGGGRRHGPGGQRAQQQHAKGAGEGRTHQNPQARLVQ